ncbi:MAG: hypothetical protein H6765_03555 [Candidatus Peribacteria bacterium]|nr:MAG: hypothetical protein H6765_03555 [Candidatus Peribacteria bacterium]
MSLFMLVLMILQGGDRTGKVIIFLMWAIGFFGSNWYLFWVKKLPHAYKVDGKKE